MAKLSSKFKLTVCAGQSFKIRPIVRPYRREEYHVLRKEKVFK